MLNVAINTLEREVNYYAVNILINDINLKIKFIESQSLRSALVDILDILTSAECITRGDISSIRAQLLRF